MTYNEDFSFTTKHSKELEIIEEQINQQYKLLSELKSLFEQKNYDIDFNDLIDKVSSIIENNTKTLTNLKQNWLQTSSKIKQLLNSIKDSNNKALDEQHQIYVIKKIIDDYNDIFRNQKQIINNNTIELLNLIIKQNIPGLKLKTSNFSFDNLTNDNQIVDNNVLTISEKDQQVFLPYKKAELEEYLKQFPQKYSSINDVIRQEFIFPLSYYSRHTNLARFRECYSLIRDKEGKSVIDALKYAFDYMFRYEINPAIIAACKTQSQFEEYLEALKNNNLDNFKEFKIVFNVAPHATI